MTANSESEPAMQKESPPLCPVCGSEATLPYREIFDDRFGHPDQFELVYCSDCSHLMTQPRLREEALAELYGTYYPRKNISADQVKQEAAGINRAFAVARRWLMGVDNQGQYCAQPGEKMLDIGCGSGLSLLEAQALGVEAWGIEADPNVSRFADQLGLRIHQGSLHDGPFGDVEFDLVVLNQVIEHIPEPDKALLAIRRRLAGNGRVVLIFPNVNSLWCRLSGASWINWHVPYHLHHFSLETFSRMSERCGYRVIRSRTITPNLWSLLQLRANRQTIVRGQKNPMWKVEALSASAPEASPGGLRFSVRRLLRLPVLLLVALFNRSVDLSGYGDSLMVELRPSDSRK